MTIYDQTGKIVEKKFYHSEWKITDLLKARNDGLLTDEGEAWKYRYSHMDGTGGKYDLLFRREPAATPSDHLALVAAAYRDAADKAFAWMTSKDEKIVEARIDANMQILTGEGSETADAVLVQTAIHARTPADAEAHLTALLRAEYERGKAETDALWSRNSRDTFDAMCAMRDAINEHVPMPSLESDLLQGPEASVFCAAVAEAVIGALLTQEGR